MLSSSGGKLDGGGEGGEGGDRFPFIFLTSIFLFLFLTSF